MPKSKSEKKRIEASQADLESKKQNVYLFPNAKVNGKTGVAVEADSQEQARQYLEKLIN